MTNTANVEIPTRFVERQPSDDTASSGNLVVPEGVFGDGCEIGPAGVGVPISRQ